MLRRHLPARKMGEDGAERLVVVVDVPPTFTLPVPAFSTAVPCAATFLLLLLLRPACPGRAATLLPAACAFATRVRA